MDTNNTDTIVDDNNNNNNNTNFDVNLGDNPDNNFDVDLDGNDGFLDYDDGIIDEYDVGILSDDDYGFEENWVEDKTPIELNNAFDKVKITREFNDIEKFLENYKDNPTSDIKKIKVQFESLHQEYSSLIESIPLLKELYDELGPFIKEYELLYDDIEYAQNLEKEDREKEEKLSEKLINKKRKNKKYKTNVDNYYKKQEMEKNQKDLDKYMNINKHRQIPQENKQQYRNFL